MPNYLCVASGLLAGAQPWSFRAYAVSSGTEGATQTTWDTAVQAWWNSAAWLALMPSTTTLTGTYTSTMTANFKQSTKTANTHNIAGGASAAALSWSTCCIATLRTALASKAGRGRWYLPAPATTALATTGYMLSSTAQTDLQAALNALGTALGSSVTLQVFHRHATLSGLPALSLTPVTTADCSNKFGVQRRRGDKVVPTRLTWTP